MECNDHFTKLAASMFGVPCAKVSPEMRRVAKQRALAGSYTARISNVQVVEQACCKEGKVRVDVVVDHVEPQRKVCKHRALGAAFGMPDIEVTPNPNPVDFTKIEEHVLAMYNTGKDDKQRADEYEKLLLKAFPLVSKKAGPLSAKDFEVRLHDLHVTKLAVNRALRDAGIEMDGPLRSRVRKLADRNNEMGAELFGLKQGLTRLVEVGQRAGLYWDDAETQRLLTVAPTKAVCRLISKLTGVRYAFRASVAKAEAEARERAKAAAKDTWQAATFAATIAGGVVGSVLTYLLV